MHANRGIGCRHRGVIAMIGKFDTRAGFFRATFGAHGAGKDALANHREILELALKFVVEKVVVTRRRTCAARTIPYSEKLEHSHERPIRFREGAS